MKKNSRVKDVQINQKDEMIKRKENEIIALKDKAISIDSNYSDKLKKAEDAKLASEKSLREIQEKLALVEQAKNDSEKNLQIKNQEIKNLQATLEKLKNEFDEKLNKKYAETEKIDQLKSGYEENLKTKNQEIENYKKTIADMQDAKNENEKTLKNKTVENEKLTADNDKLKIELTENLNAKENIIKAVKNAENKGIRPFEAEERLRKQCEETIKDLKKELEAEKGEDLGDDDRHGTDQDVLQNGVVGPLSLLTLDRITNCLENKAAYQKLKDEFEGVKYKIDEALVYFNKEFKILEQSATKAADMINPDFKRDLNKVKFNFSRKLALYKAVITKETEFKGLYDKFDKDKGHLQYY